MLVICGSPDFDLASLESATIYQDGYDKDSQTVRDFWEIAHSLSEEDKKKLLFFVTGNNIQQQQSLILLSSLIIIS